MEGGRLGVHRVVVANKVILAHKTAHAVARIHLPVVSINLQSGSKLNNRTGSYIRLILVSHHTVLSC